jgi:sulfonate transport system substrate-binding protein
MNLPRRSVLLSLGALAFVAITAPVHAQSKLSELRIDWATYNPVSIIITNKGLL